MGDCQYRDLIKGLWTCALISQLIFPSSLFPKSIYSPSTAYAHQEEEKTDSLSVQDLIKRLGVDEYLRSPERLSQEEFNEIFQHSEIDQEVLGLFYQGLEFGNRIYSEVLDEVGGDHDVAAEKFYARVDADLVNDTSNGPQSLRTESTDISEESGNDVEEIKVELTRIDGKAAVRVIFQSENFVFLGSDLKSDHLEKFLSRVALNRRTTIFKVDFDEGLLGSKAQTNIQGKAGIEWLKEYWRAIYKTPTRGQVVLGIFFGLLQGFLVLESLEYFNNIAIASMDPYGPGATALTKDAYNFLTQYGQACAEIMATISVVFGTVLGIFSSTKRRWTLEVGTGESQLRKRAAISILARYIFEFSKAILTGRGVMSTFFGLSGVGVHGHIAYNTLISNSSRSLWYVWPKMIEQMKEYGEQEVVFQVSKNKKIPLGYKRSDFIVQATYLIPFLLSKFDQVFKGVWLDFGGVSLPASLVVFGLVGFVLPMVLNETSLLWRLKHLEKIAATGNGADKARYEKFLKLSKKRHKEFIKTLKDIPSFFLVTVPKFTFVTLPKRVLYDAPVAIAKHSKPFVQKSCQVVFRSIFP